MTLSSFPDDFEVAVIGASGGIGAALVNELCAVSNISHIYAFSRQASGSAHAKLSHKPIDLEREDSIEMAANTISDKVRLVIIASGFLHQGDMQPEKSLKDISLKTLEANFKINCFGPALILKHFLPRLPREEKSVIAALSARVGSISDNRLGGWYSYRASKAALNMMIKTASIEAARKWKDTAIIGLHPGTVDTGLSGPFQSNVPSAKLFSADESARYLLHVINNIRAKDTGQIFDWQGKVIEP